MSKISNEADTVKQLRKQAKHLKNKDMLVNLRTYMEANHKTFNPDGKRAWRRDKIFKHSLQEQKGFKRWAIEQYLNNQIDYDNLVGKRTKLKIGKKITKPETIEKTYYTIDGDDRLKNKLFSPDEIEQFGFKLNTNQEKTT